VVTTNLIALYKALGGGWEGVQGIEYRELDRLIPQPGNDLKTPPPSSHLTADEPRRPEER